MTTKSPLTLLRDALEAFIAMEIATEAAGDWGSYEVEEMPVVIQARIALAMTADASEQAPDVPIHPDFGAYATLDPVVEANAVAVDRRDLWDNLRMAWRDGLMSEFPGEAESWQAATEYANEIVSGWASLAPARPAPDEWQQAIYDACAVAFVDCGPTSNPRKTVEALIQAHIDFAARPAPVVATVAPTLAEESLSTLLWLYRRLPRGYARIPAIERTINALATKLGTDVESCFAERGAAAPAAPIAEQPRPYDRRKHDREGV